MKNKSEIQIVKNLLQMGTFLQKTGNRLIREFDLTQQQFVVLNEIAEKRSVSQKQIVGELLFEKSNVSKIVKKLHLAGLINVSSSSEDARTTVLSITKKGKKQWTECMHLLNTWSIAWLEPLNENEITDSVKTLCKLRSLIPVAITE